MRATGFREYSEVRRGDSPAGTWIALPGCRKKRRRRRRRRDTRRNASAAKKR